MQHPSTASNPLIGLKLKTSLPKPTDVLMALPPLVDVLFLLFIFFILGSSLVFQEGLPVDPPTLDEPYHTFADKLVITYISDEEIFFNDQRVRDFAELENELAKVVQAEMGSYQHDDVDGAPRAPIIIIKADREVVYGGVVQLVSIARKYGAGVILATKAAAP